MPSYDFEVDLPVLVSAARGVTETIQLLKDKDVEDLVPGEGAVGHPAVWNALDEFKDRWELGLNNLMRDAEEAGSRLTTVATNYANFDRAGNERMKATAASVRAADVMPR
jgi:hypothetical protein